MPTDQIISALMLVDILVLTGLLYLTAGMANPFRLFYFVNVAMAAAIITPRAAWRKRRGTELIFGWWVNS